ncbi:hypothetical protein M406DRAFT_260437 [Cryphonectria parasitica EP155]|uniref:polynucleotide adenylyltransferase n=1 Tax=Cryphonectria parasitica (strain ATCC 38755 / EP155) TaxID=660469 RepID=A0A9P4Y2B1_CRYP1|nr:uncharacterized protein M406DRAFT_260437 [Cryphonectria parasitica EP155]KAF3765173.1 hypothetical protein M406DRAFT_260437 [Cryphonectria parasitica EP155]
MGKDKESIPPAKGKDTAPQKPPLKAQPDLAHPLPSRPAHRAAQAHQQSAASSSQSSSVPSTPHQRARDFFEESREPSPNAIQSHSPRSVYSEPHGGAATLPTRQPQSQRPCPFETASVKFRRRMPYSLGAEKLERIDAAKIKSKLSEDEERKLSTDMREIYDRLLPSSEVEQNRERLVKKLEKIFNEEWPGHDIQVHLFGSSGNLLCSDDSDGGMEKVVCISRAKVPIVKIWDPELKLACDMNVNNTLALENTRMVRTYVETDERVRPLAMVIKYWTKRRVVNDAAFGFTLSSYTWICMIIAFLQLREPPVLPALHQCPHLKLPAAGGHKSDFADDLSQLKGFGRENKKSIGELLFEFFRFYAHEFDYETMALSVRLGKMIPKTQKKWNHAMNNMLCVEEPFNRERNLGNTADDFSFRGLHLELRRAFDLVAKGRLHECCEQFIFPKEEPSENKGFVKPAPRPAIIRSSSQQQPGRGGRNGGGRGNRNHLRNGNSNRRASSSHAYENSQASAAGMGAAALPHPLLINPAMQAGDLQQWSQLAQQYASYPAADMAMLSNAFFAQERWQWFAHHQAQAQLHQHAVQQHAQRLQASAALPTERSRTSSFDQPPPLTAPIRPEYYVWPPHLQPNLYPQQQQQPQHQQHHAGFGTYPNSPSASTAAPEFRRSLHRSNAANESGSSSSSGALRSQSQPASRTSAPIAQAARGVSGAMGNAPQANLSPFPAFAPDDKTDSEADGSSSRTLPDSPPEEDSAGYLGYFVAGSNIPSQKISANLSVLGDMGLSRASRRRLSTEGPQSVLDRRLQRTSRSPSPLGHGRTISAGANSAPLASVPFPHGINRSAKEGAPLVANGTHPVQASHLPWPPTAADDATYDNPLHISQTQSASSPLTTEATTAARPQVTPDLRPAGPPDRPLVVDGTITQSPVSPPTTASIPSFGQRLAGPHGIGSGYYATVPGDGAQNKTKAADFKWQRVVSRNQPGIAPRDMAPLDLAMPASVYSESQHLSPVYETRTPSPTAYREKLLPIQSVGSLDLPWQAPRVLEPPHKPSERNGTAKDNEPGLAQLPRTTSQAARESTTASRTTRGELENGSNWQKAKTRKKQSDTRATGRASTHSEQPPKNESERKGG